MHTLEAGSSARNAAPRCINDRHRAAICITVPASAVLAPITSAAPLCASMYWKSASAAAAYSQALLLSCLQSLSQYEEVCFLSAVGALMPYSDSRMLDASCIGVQPGSAC